MYSNIYRNELQGATLTCPYGLREPRGRWASSRNLVFTLAEHCKNPRCGDIYLLRNRTLLTKLKRYCSFKTPIYRVSFKSYGEEISSLLYTPQSLALWPKRKLGALFSENGRKEGNLVTFVDAMPCCFVRFLQVPCEKVPRLNFLCLQVFLTNCTPKREAASPLRVSAH